MNARVAETVSRKDGLALGFLLAVGVEGVASKGFGERHCCCERFLSRELALDAMLLLRSEEV